MPSFEDLKKDDSPNANANLWRGADLEERPPARAPIAAAPPAAEVEDDEDEDQDGGKEDSQDYVPSEGPKYKTKALDSHYDKEQEDSSSFRGSPERYNKLAETKDANFTKVKTKYLDYDEQNANQLDVEDGLLNVGGKALDTRDASGIGTQKAAGQGKYIFAMEGNGAIKTLDPWKAHEEKALNEEGTEHEMSFINHSSLVAEENDHGGMKGAGAAAAGELTAHDGKLVQVSDQSGHYRPDNNMTYNAVDELQSSGVDMHDVGMKLTPKQKGERYLHASAREFMNYEGADDAEAQMRGQRAAFGNELTGAVAAREARAAKNQMRMGGADVGRTEGRLDPSKKKARNLINLFGGMY